MPVPPYIRRIQQQCYADGCEQRWQETPLAAEHQDEAERRQDPVRHSVFRKKPQSCGEPDREPPSPFFSLTRTNERVECDCPEKQQRRIGRNDERGNRYSGKADIGDRRPEPDAPLVKPGPNAIDEDRRAGMQKRRGQPNRELAVGKNSSRCSDQPRDKRRLRIVAERQLLRPNPVLRFVREQIGWLQCQPNQTQRGNRCDAGEHPLTIGTSELEPDERYRVVGRDPTDRHATRFIAAFPEAYSSNFVKLAPSSATKTARSRAGAVSLAFSLTR